MQTNAKIKSMGPIWVQKILSIQGRPIGSHNRLSLTVWKTDCKWSIDSRREPRELRQRNSPIPWSSLESFRPITWYEFSPLKKRFFQKLGARCFW